MLPQFVGPYPPVRRSYSVQVNHHHHHVVALTSSTLGSRNLDPRDPYNKPRYDHPPPIQIPAGDGQSDTGGGSERKKTPKEEFEMGMVEAKTWSLLINDKTARRTRDHQNPLRPAARHFRSFSFHAPSCSGEDQPTPRIQGTIRSLELSRADDHVPGLRIITRKENPSTNHTAKANHSSRPHGIAVFINPLHKYVGGLIQLHQTSGYLERSKIRALYSASCLLISRYDERPT
ncbi:glutaredoxin family protein [Striga asiatica]|uniref:Glutaredoxin family protein n=1 Tax=Striga asiatica TaxID=4170 RepID=A0A5A7PPJ6_STRAF|nr:glutaredoxin family protein [Striga asiatica]